MGGLAGIPFTGKTGFTAYSHHIPDSTYALAVFDTGDSSLPTVSIAPTDGNLFVLFAPHIGLCDSCHLGKYSRKGNCLLIIQTVQHTFSLCVVDIGHHHHT